MWSTAPTEQDARKLVNANCQRQFGNCTNIFAACETSDNPADLHGSPELVGWGGEGADAPPPAVVAPPTEPDVPAMDWGKIIEGIIWYERKVLGAAIGINAILFISLFQVIRANRHRLYILAALTLANITLYFALPPILQSLRGIYDLYTALYVIQRTAEIGILTTGLSFAILSVISLINGGLPDSLPTASKHIEVLIVRSQRRNWLNRVVFMIDVRMGVSLEQLQLMKKYRLGRTLVFDSARRERQNELARAQWEMAREKASRTICLWREEWRGFFKRIYYLIRALISFLLGFLFIRVTLAKLIKGSHIESKSLDTILAAKHAIETAATDLKRYLEVAESFDGREDLFEPS
jgi:hypothetical protein